MILFPMGLCVSLDIIQQNKNALQTSHSILTLPTKDIFVGQSLKMYKIATQKTCS